MRPRCHTRTQTLARNTKVPSPQFAPRRRPIWLCKEQSLPSALVLGLRVVALLEESVDCGRGSSRLGLWFSEQVSIGDNEKASPRTARVRNKAQSCPRISPKIGTNFETFCFKP